MVLYFALYVLESLCVWIVNAYYVCFSVWQLLKGVYSSHVVFTLCHCTYIIVKCPPNRGVWDLRRTRSSRVRSFLPMRNAGRVLLSLAAAFRRPLPWQWDLLSIDVTSLQLHVTIPFQVISCLYWYLFWCMRCIHIYACLHHWRCPYQRTVKNLTTTDLLCSFSIIVCVFKVSRY